MWLDGKHEHVGLTRNFSHSCRNERLADAIYKLLKPRLGNIERSDTRYGTGRECPLGQCATEVSNPDNAEGQLTAHDFKCMMQAVGSLNALG